MSYKGIVVLLCIGALFLGGCSGIPVRGTVVTDKSDGEQAVYDAQINVDGYTGRSGLDGSFTVRIPEGERNVEIVIDREGYRRTTFHEFIRHGDTSLSLGTIYLPVKPEDLAQAYGTVNWANVSGARGPNIVDREYTKPLPDDIDVKMGPHLTPSHVEEHSQIIVVYHDLLSVQEEGLSLHGELEVEVVKALEGVGGEVIKLPQGVDIYEAMQRYEQDARVKYAEVDHKVYLADHPVRTPNDEYYEEYQWNLPFMYMDEAWYLTTGSRDIKVAILDSGIVRHVDLFPSTHNPGNVNWGLAKSFVDDTPYDYGASEGNPSHGTQIAGIIGALTNNHEGVAGASWKVDLIPVKVMDETGGWVSDVAEGLYYAADVGAHIVNLSLCTPNHSTTLRDAVRHADHSGVLLVAAAGNTGDAGIMYPARYSEVLAIGALKNTGERAPYSTYGPELDLMAPGGRITDPHEPYGGILSTSGYYDDGWKQRYTFMEGTSLAAAHVSGVAALLMARSSGWTPEDIRETLISAGSRYPNHNQYLGYGLLDAYYAVKDPLTPPFDLREMKVFAGRQLGSTLYVFSEVTYPYLWRGNYEYDLYEIDPGWMQVFAWYDADGSGRVRSGDYFAESDSLRFRPGRSLEVHLGVETLQARELEEPLEILWRDEFDREEILEKINALEEG